MSIPWNALASMKRHTSCHSNATSLSTIVCSPPPPPPLLLPSDACADCTVTSLSFEVVESGGDEFSTDVEGVSLFTGDENVHAG